MSRSDWPARLPFYYGWVVVAVAFVTMAIALGVRTAFSLLYPPILDEFGWQRGLTAGAFTLGFVFSTVFAPVLGAAMDRYGPRFVIPGGAVIVAGGLVAATRISTPFELYITLGVLVVGASVTMSYMGHSMFLPSWFERRRGLAVGIAFSGVGVGSILILPWLQTMIGALGWRYACLVLAFLLLAVVVPLNAVFQRTRPASVGLLPDGAGAVGTPPRRPRVDNVVDRSWAETQWTLRGALATGRFWWITAGYFTALYAWYAVLVHQTRYLIDNGFSTDVAAVALGLVGTFGIAGQIGLGAFSDRYGRELGWTVALAGYVLCYLLLLAIPRAPSLTLVYAMVAAQGLLGFGLSSIYGTISYEVFSGPRFSTIFAVISLGGNIGAGIGPLVTGLIFDLSGSYHLAFELCAVLSAISIVCIWIGAPRKVRLAPGVAVRRAASSAA